jgi:FkbM family methyltransferase
MYKNLHKFLNEIVETNIYSAYHHLESDNFSEEEKLVAEKLKIICTSYLIRERQNKLNSLGNLKKNGFSPTLVVDVGAQVGTPELYQAFPDSHHIFIEPVAECIPALVEISKNLQACTIYNCAVSNVNEISKLSLSETRQYSSIDATIGTEFRSIDVRTVDSIYEDSGDHESILLKIDVDGIELKVLQGSRKLFNKECVIIIEATLGDKNPRFNILVEYLSAYGFKVFDIVDPLYRPRDWHLWQVDLVFVKSNSLLWNSHDFS